VLVIVPTHDHHETLAFSVRSILEQTVTDIEVVIVGDGVTTEVRSVAQDLCAADERVRFEDRPKTARHGEELRDRVVRESTAPFIAYNGDDDLWFPDHLETMLSTIEGFDFAHPLPILIDAHGVPYFLPSNLRDPSSIAWHLGPKPRNSISLSGVVHTRESYMRLPHGWRTTPAGRWTDHYMWEQFFEQDWFRGVTAPRSTTLKLVAVGRDEERTGSRAAEMQAWWDRLHSPEFANVWDRSVRDAMWRAAVNLNVTSATQEDEITCLQNVIDDTIAALNESDADRDRLRGELAHAEHELEAVRTNFEHTTDELALIRSTISWRLTKPLRFVRRFFPRRRGDQSR
jgi:hypothetical protein